MYESDKSDIVNKKTNATTVIFHEVKRNKMSVDLPFGKEIKEANIVTKDNALQKYSKYFGINTYTGDEPSGPGGMTDEALYIQLEYDEDPHKMIDESFKMAKSQNLSVSDIATFLARMQMDLEIKIMTFEENCKRATLDVLEKCIPKDVAIVMYEIRKNNRDMFINRFVEKSMTLYDVEMDNEFQRLENKFGFSLFNFDRDGRYRENWTKAIGLNLLYKDDLLLKNLSMAEAMRKKAL